MHPPSSAETIATKYWANHFGCDATHLFAEPLRLVTHGSELADYHGVFGLFRRGAAIVSLPAKNAEALAPMLLGSGEKASPEFLASLLKPVAAMVIGPAFLGYALTPPAGADSARALGSADAHHVGQLRHACPDIEWEHGGSSLELPCSGVFVESRLVALAGYETWGGAIAHIAVVTHPDFRGNHFGRSAVAHLTRRALCAGLLPQYRTLESNAASMCLAQSLGFQAYARSLAIRLPA